MHGLFAEAVHSAAVATSHDIFLVAADPGAEAAAAAAAVTAVGGMVMRTMLMTTTMQTVADGGRHRTVGAQHRGDHAALAWPAWLGRPAPLSMHALPS